MLARLVLLFALVPLVELILLVEIGRRIGTVPTVLLVIGTGLLGAYFAKSQGLATLRRVQRDLERGQVPAEGLIDGVLILLGGLLLLTPGVLTDAAGLLLVLPAPRFAFKRWLRRRLEHAIASESFYIRWR